MSRSGGWTNGNVVVAVLLGLVVCGFIAAIIFIPSPPPLIDDPALKARMTEAVKAELTERLGDDYKLELQSINYSSGGILSDPYYSGRAYVTVGETKFEISYRVNLEYTSLSDFSPVKKE